MLSAFCLAKAKSIDDCICRIVSAESGEIAVGEDENNGDKD